MSSESKQAPSHEYYVNLARTAPTIDSHDDVERDHRQFGNNFYLLFLARKRKEVDPDGAKGDTLVGAYLNRAEEYGDKWQRFVEENRELICQLDEALEGQHLYRELLSHFIALIKEGQQEGRFDEAEKFNSEVRHPLGIEAVGIYVWDKINPLLEKVAERMEEAGIPSREFFG